MSEQNPSSNQFWSLLDDVCDGNLDEAQTEELSALLDSDPAFCEVFAQHVQLRTNIRFLSLAEHACDGGLTQVRATLPHAASPFGFLSSTIPALTGYVSGWPAAYLIATVICGIGALIGAFTHVSHSTQIAKNLPEVITNHVVPGEQVIIVGRITGMVDCKWSNASKELTSKYVVLGQKIVLSSGIMEITYNTGAKAILQAPVTYEVESKNGGFLSLGKLTGKVEVEKAKGFVIHTPTATITDLGTEFCVEVDRQGSTLSHVFRGSVKIQSVGEGTKTGSDVCVLHENQSAQIKRHGNKLEVVSLSNALVSSFIRELPKSSVNQAIKVFDLVDVVAGGDGFSGKRERGIDPRSGRIVDAMVGDSETTPLIADGHYYRVTDMPFVDGVFIPDGEKETMQVDSSGHCFDGFQGTVGKTWQPVWAGGPMCGREYSTKAWGVDFNSPGHGQILLHASNAITFDLEAIRNANPGCRLLAFHAMAGNSVSSTSVMREQYVDFWVLVDAQPRFRRRQIRSSDGAYTVVVPISPSDRFLTLAATDGGDGISHDWIIFGDPRLEILTTNTKP